MDGLYFAITLGAVPFFASRVFASVFWLSVGARVLNDGHLTFLQDLAFLNVDLRLTHPDWFISELAMLVFGFLAVIEGAAEKNPDLAELFRTFDAEVKGFGNLIFGNLVSGSARIGLAAGSATVLVAGFGLHSLWALVTGFLVWLVSRLRREVLKVLSEADEDDSLGLRRLISWGEELWVGGGIFLLLLIPALALVASALSVGLLYLLRIHFIRREEKNKVACGQCGAANFATALTCFSCKSAMPQPLTVGMFGQATAAAAPEPEQHRLALKSRKRCPACGFRFNARRCNQQCEACQTPLFADRAELDTYLTHTATHLPKVMLVTFLFGLVPVIGLIPAIIYYRLHLVAPLKRYVPRSVGCLTKWLVRLAALVLIVLQPVPFAGAFSPPLLCLINYYLYRAALQREGSKLA